MACERCTKEGKQKIIHFQRCGRWETRIFCEHTYKRASIQSNNKEFGERGRLRHVVTERIKRKPTPHGRQVYTAEMDAFILANYNPSHKWGKHVNERMAKEFVEKFKIPATLNALVGRHHRLIEMGEEKAEPVRGVPSLPVLKFMQGS